MWFKALTLTSSLYPPATLLKIVFWPAFLPVGVFNPYDILSFVCNMAMKSPLWEIVIKKLLLLIYYYYYYYYYYFYYYYYYMNMHNQ